MKKIIISCGGTGGHIYPGIAIGQVLKKGVKGIEILYVGTERGMEKKLILMENFNFAGISSGKIIRKAEFVNILNLFKFLKGIFQSTNVIKNFKPDLIIGMGGYVSAPVAIAGWLKAVKVLLHEQNVMPGLANKFIARIAKKVLVSFKDSIRFFPDGKAVFTGNPVRDEIGKLNKQDCMKRIGLDAAKKTLSVIGGSQGAHKINSLIFETLKLLSTINIQVVWMTGEKDYELYKNKLKEIKCKIIMQPFFYNIAEIYAVTDLLVCRAGASTIAEIIKCNIPAIFIPLPSAAHNHQFYNANLLVRENAAILFEEKNLLPEILAKKICELITDDKILKELSFNLKKMNEINCGETILKEIMSIL